VLRDGNESDSERAIFHYLLRNESGVSVNFWDSDTTLPLLQSFCKNSVVTPRVRAVASMVPRLIDIYFDVLISYADEKILCEILRVLFQRLDQVRYPDHSILIAIVIVILVA